MNRWWLFCDECGGDLRGTEIYCPKCGVQHGPRHWAEAVLWTICLPLMLPMLLVFLVLWLASAVGRGLLTWVDGEPPADRRSMRMWFESIAEAPATNPEEDEVFLVSYMQRLAQMALHELAPAPPPVGHPDPRQLARAARPAEKER
jgi:hypothetical protein